MLGDESSGKKAGGCRDDPLVNIAPSLIGNEGNESVLTLGVVFGALVLGNCVVDGSGGIVAVCKPDADLFGGGTCDAADGKVSFSQEGGAVGSAGGALFELDRSSPDAVTTAKACALPRSGLS